MHRFRIWVATHRSQNNRLSSSFPFHLYRTLGVTCMKNCCTFFNFRNTASYSPQRDIIQLEIHVPNPFHSRMKPHPSNCIFTIDRLTYKGCYMHREMLWCIITAVAGNLISPHHSHTLFCSEYFLSQHNHCGQYVQSVLCNVFYISSIFSFYAGKRELEIYTMHI